MALLEKSDGGGHQEGKIMENLCALGELPVILLIVRRSRSTNTRALTSDSVGDPDVAVGVVGGWGGVTEA